MRRATASRLAALTGFVAVTLAAMSGLHLSGVLAGGAEPFDPQHAGIAEAAICAVLAAGAVALARRPARARPFALAAVAFAIAGFVVGLNFTVRGGGVFDVAYHAVALPVLVLAAALLLRSSRATDDSCGAVRSDGEERPRDRRESECAR